MKAKPVILVVDDQPQNIEILEAHLAPQGYEIVTAASGEEALGKLSGNQIDLMLLDVIMPGMDGFEVTRRVRQDNTHRQIPIILVTALRDAEDRIKGIDAGCDDFISKPFDKLELLARVRSLLKVKAYNDLMSHYREELESEVAGRTEELKQALEKLQQDIIERKQAEEALKESEEKYRGLVENISDVLYELDSQVVVAYISPVIRNILGYDSAEVIGKNLIEFVYKDDVSILEKRFSELRKGIEFPFDYRFVNKSGELRWARTNTRPIMEDGLFKGARGTLIDVTDRKKLESALRESAEKFQRFFMTSRDCVFITSKEGSWIDMNDAAAELFGYSSREELMQVNISDLYISTEERTRHIDVIAERGYCKEFPVDLRRKDGVVIHTLITSVAIYDAEKNVTGFQGTVRDITARKLAEEQIRIFRYFAEASGQGLGMATLDGDMTYINPRLCHLLGEEKPEDVYKKKLALYYPQEMRERLEKEVLPAVMSKGQWTGELALINTQRKYTPTIENFFLIRDEAGNPLCLADVITDITDLKQTEKVLRANEEKFRSHFENVSDVIFSFDREFRILSISPSLERVLGYKPEEFIGKSFAELNILPPEDLKMAFSDTMRVFDGEHLDAVSYAFIARDGSRKFVEFSSTPLLREGQVVAVFCVARDVTERKHAEEQLKHTLESLRRSFQTTIQVMVSAVETRDPYTSGHQRRSADIARAIATEMGLPQETIDGIRMAGSIHDIGKLSIPAEILSKPGKLSAIEFSLIKEHARRGFEMLKDVESPWPLAEIVYQHHERIDGSGYPRNLKGNDIIMEARILAVADVVESMASHRPYRAALGINAALEEIEKNKGTLYDADVADACLRLFREKGFQLERVRY